MLPADEPKLWLVALGVSAWVAVTRLTSTWDVRRPLVGTIGAFMVSMTASFAVGFAILAVESGPFAERQPWRFLIGLIGGGWAGGIILNAISRMVERWVPGDLKSEKENADVNR